MKKSLIILAIVFGIISCTDNTQPTTITSEGGNNPGIARKFTFENHSYIYFEMYPDGRRYDHGCGYVHDPDCACRFIVEEEK